MVVVWSRSLPSRSGWPNKRQRPLPRVNQSRQTYGASPPENLNRGLVRHEITKNKSRRAGNRGDFQGTSDQSSYPAAIARATRCAVLRSLLRASPNRLRLSRRRLSALRKMPCVALRRLGCRVLARTAVSMIGQAGKPGPLGHASALSRSSKARSGFR